LEGSPLSGAYLSISIDFKRYRLSLSFIVGHTAPGVRGHVSVTYLERESLVVATYLMHLVFERGAMSQALWPDGLIQPAVVSADPCV